MSICWHIPSKWSSFILHRTAQLTDENIYTEAIDKLLIHSQEVEDVFWRVTVNKNTAPDGISALQHVQRN